MLRYRPDRFLRVGAGRGSVRQSGQPDAAAFSAPGLDATFSTGASSFRATDIALLLSGGAPSPDQTFTVSLIGGVPLADVSFDPVLGLNFRPGGPALAAVTLPASDLSTSLAIEHFNQFASITLQPNSLYWIDVASRTPKTAQ